MKSVFAFLAFAVFGSSACADSLARQFAETIVRQNAQVPGMLEIWTGASTSAHGFGTGRRASENGKTIKAAAAAYSYDPSGLP